MSRVLPQRDQQVVYGNILGAAGRAISRNEGARMSHHKYRQIIEKLQDDICSGNYKPGGRLPSESELVRRFGASRMTVFRAMRELQTLGLITRRVGSGTFVSSNSHSGSHMFGLLIPELGQTEIFEGICKGMMESQEAMHHSLLWGNSVSKEQDKEKAAEQLCEHYISRKVSGVFFAPVEYSTNRFQSNHRIVAALIEHEFPSFFLTDALSPILGAANMIWSVSITVVLDTWPPNT